MYQEATREPVVLHCGLLRHVLPKGFQKIRHCGLYASAADAQLQRARDSLKCSGAEQARLNIERFLSWRWQVFDLLRVHKPQRLPIVLSTGEVRAVLQAVRHPVRRMAVSPLQGA